FLFFFFFQAEDGIRDFHVTGVQTCALPICHETLDPQPGQLHDLPNPLHRLLRGQPALRRLARCVYLYQAGHRAPRPLRLLRQLLREPQRVDAVDEIEQWKGAPHLVALKVPDQVPFAAVAPHRRHLRFELLDAVLPEPIQTRGQQRLHRLGAVTLGHRDDRYLVPPPRTLQCTRQSLPHSGQRLRQPRSVHLNLSYFRKVERSTRRDRPCGRSLRSALPDAALATPCCRQAHFARKSIGSATHTGTRLSRFSAGENCMMSATFSAASSSDLWPLDSLI